MNYADLFRATLPETALEIAALLVLVVDLGFLRKAALKTRVVDCIPARRRRLRRGVLVRLRRGLGGPQRWRRTASLRGRRGKRRASRHPRPHCAYLASAY